MVEFFKGGRRKIGVVTLVMACVFAMAWFRSLFNDDVAQLYRGSTHHQIQLCRGFVAWASEPMAIEEESNKQLGLMFSSHSLLGPNATMRDMRTWCEWTHEWNACGFIFGEKDHTIIWVIPLWSIVIPLTLLSAYLLLVKPRAAKPKKTIEPTTGEGT